MKARTLKTHACACEGDLMKTLKLQPVTTLAAACLLSLVSATAIAGGSGGPGFHSNLSPLLSPAAPTVTTTQTTGQPNASCEDTPNQPGNSISAPGSAFNPDGKSGTVYAGEQPQNSVNPNSVSQYDVACTRPSH
jgi:hypothetical protein